MRESYNPGSDLTMKARILTALQNLICGESAQPLDKVTVKELCDKVGITTRTFYNHFSDKYDVVTWFMELSGADSFAQIGIMATPQEALNSYVYVIRKYGDFLTACGKSKYGSCPHDRKGTLRHAPASPLRSRGMTGKARRNPSRQNGAPCRI